MISENDLQVVQDNGGGFRIFEKEGWGHGNGEVDFEQEHLRGGSIWGGEQNEYVRPYIFPTKSVVNILGS